MSTINLILKPDAAYVISDGASVDDLRSGKLVGRLSKLIQMPHIPAVIAVRGRLQMLQTIAAISAMSKANTFQELRASFVDDCRRNWRFRILSKLTGGADIGVAGWCERDGPSSFFFSSSKIHPDGPWTMTILEPGSFFACPSTEEMLERDFESFSDLRGDALRLLQAQRQLRIPGKPKAVMAAGFATLTTIDRRSIKTELIGVWPDVIGKHIDRAATPVPAAGVVGRIS